MDMMETSRSRSLSIWSFLILCLVSLCLMMEPAGGGDASLTLTRYIHRAPVAGQFLVDAAHATSPAIYNFVADDASPVDMGHLPSLGDVLASGDPSAVPVIGTLVTGGRSGSRLQMIPGTPAAHGLSARLPVIGWIPLNVTGHVLATNALPAPSHAVGLIPVVGPDGEAVAVLIATAHLDPHQMPPTVSIVRASESRHAPHSS
jgi:hypothetical protein